MALPKLEIKPLPDAKDGKAYLLDMLDIRVGDVSLTGCGGLRGIDLELRAGEINRLTLHLHVGDVKIDADVMQELQAVLDKAE